MALGGSGPLGSHEKSKTSIEFSQVVRFKEEPSTEFNAVLWCFFRKGINLRKFMCL